METTIKPVNNSKNAVKVIGIILSMVIPAYFIMLWISPESKYLARFLSGFGASYAGIVLIAYFINYIKGMYRQIQNKS